jgi:hypothetical protein
MEGMVEDGEFIPEPTSLDAVAKSRDAQGASSSLVRVELPGKSVRVNITGKPGNSTTSTARRREAAWTALRS